GVDAADLFELRARERLAVRRDRERLELRAAQAHRPPLHDLAHERAVRDRGSELITARDLDQLDPAALVLALELAEQSLDVRRLRASDACEALGRHRRIGDEDEALD